MASSTIDCAICADRTRGATQPLYLDYGITIALCADHASADFQRRDEGRAFIRALERLWAANGCLTAARSKALQAHARALRPAEARSRPGSYTWAGLRNDAERLFAAGEPARPTIDLLRRAVSVEGARPPSVRTMMRWHSERRWLAAAQA